MHSQTEFGNEKYSENSHIPRPSFPNSVWECLPRRSASNNPFSFWFLNAIRNAERCRNAFPNRVWERETRSVAGMHSQTEFGNEKKTWFLDAMLSAEAQIIEYYEFFVGWARSFSCPPFCLPSRWATKLPTLQNTKSLFHCLHQWELEHLWFWKKWVLPWRRRAWQLLLK